MAFTSFGASTVTNKPSLVTLPPSLTPSISSLYTAKEIELRTAAAYSPIDNTPLSLTSITEWGLIGTNFGLGAIIGENNSASTTQTSFALLDGEYRFIFNNNMDLSSGIGIGYDFKKDTLLGEIHSLLEFRMTKNTGTFTGISIPFEKGPNFQINKINIMPIAGVSFWF